MALALLLPSFLGMSRALVSGLPLSWYGSVPEACLMYIPAALAGLLMPVKAKTKREADAAMQAMGLGTRQNAREKIAGWWRRSSDR